MSIQRIYKLDGLIRAKTRIMQTGTQKTGAHTLLPTKEIPYNDDMIAIPYISANSIRGKLRRLIMEDFCRQLDYKFKDDRIWHGFLGGGQLKGGGDGMIDAEWREEIKNKIPPIALWAFSLGNQMLKGKLIIYDLDICCEENRDYIPDHLHEFCTKSFYEYISTVFFTRRDDKQSGKVKDNEDDPAIQMKIEVQCLIPGTLFYHGICLDEYPTKIEIACLHRAIKIWNEHPTIGGKASSGYGLIELKYKGELDDKPYLEYLETHKTALCEYLDRITSEFKTKMDALAGKKKTKKSTKSKKKTEEENEDENDDDDQSTIPRETPVQNNGIRQTKLPL